MYKSLKRGYRKYPWGDNFDANKLWCCKEAVYDAGGTHRVGELGIGPYGCTDMAGNVWQWRKAWYGKDKRTRDYLADPHGPDTEQKNRVARGGPWYEVNPLIFRAANRLFFLLPLGRFMDYGFRCVGRADVR